MPRKPGLTKEQHFKLGFDLYALQERLNKAIVQIGQAYPSNGREVKKLERAARALADARSVLDDTVCRELPTGDHSAIYAYYPGGAGPVQWSA